MRTWIVLLLLLTGWALQEANAAARLPLRPASTLLLTPARPRPVQLALDAAQLRALLVITYESAAQAEPVLHLRSGADWQYISLADFADKTFTPTAIRQVIIIGDEELVPAALLHSMPWCAEVVRLPSLQIGELINGLDPILKWRSREWQWLADRYGLELTDLNAARRGYNPYDTPRSQMPLEKSTFKQAPGELAPAQLIEGSAPPASQP